MKIMKVLHQPSGHFLADKLKAAALPWERMIGLLGSKSLEPGAGLWLIPCNSIHTFGMSYPIDLIYLDKSKRVLKTVHQLKPNRFGPIMMKADSVLELPAGTLENHCLAEGDVLVIS